MWMMNRDLPDSLRSTTAMGLCQPYAVADHDGPAPRARQADARLAEVSKHAAALKVDAIDGRGWTQIALDGIAKHDQPARTRPRRSWPRC